MSSSSPDDIQTRLATIERLLASDPAAAEAEAKGLLQREPDHGLAQLFLGIARRLSGNVTGAIETLRPLCEANPDAPLAHLQLGLALRESGDNTAALASMRRAVTANRNFGDGWLALADLLVETGQMESADSAYQSYIAVAANEPQLREAGRALQENRLDDADARLRHLLGSSPRDVVAMCLLADVEEKRGNTSEAEGLLTECVRIAPGYTRARHNLAVIYLRQNRATVALEHCDITLSAEPDNPEFRKLRAAILVRLMRYDESIAVCRGLLDENPDQPTVLTSMGHMLKTVGERDAAMAAYRRAIELAPQYGEPYWSLANLKTSSVSEAELTAMEQQLQSPVAKDTDRLHFHFAIGRALEDRGEFARSFEHYATGNKIRLERHPYDPEELAGYVQQCKKFFTAGFFESISDAGSQARDPIFVLGLPRSGSTLVEQILASHSAVEGTSELPEIAAMAKSLGDWEIDGKVPGYPAVLSVVDPSVLRELGDSYIEHTQVHRKSGTPHFIDKMPNNFAHIGLIHAILPNARIVDIRRHPVACGLSLFKEHFARAQNFSYSLEYIGRYYRNYVELMAYFDRVMPGRVHHVIYESLVSSTEKEIRRLLDYCGLPYEAACLNFYSNPRAVATASSEQVRKPIYTQALDHWRNFEPWLTPLIDQLGELTDTYAEPKHLE